MQTLAGRTAVFAGASGGDGRYSVKALCAGGMNVVIMTHNVSQAERLIAEVKAADLPGDCVYFSGGNGLAAAEENAAVYADMAKHFGSIDVVISNTGANGRIDSIESLTDRDLLESLDHLVVGPFKMLQTALPYLKQSRAPRVIFMTTVEGVHGGTHESLANAVAKGAVMSLALNAASRLAPFGINVNCIAKGAITRVEGVAPGAPDPNDCIPHIPLGRVGSPADLAGVIAFLASEESSYITGQVIELSGGLNLGR